MKHVFLGKTKLTCETDRQRTSHFVTRWVLSRVPVTPSQNWTFPAESPLIMVLSDRKATLQTTTSLFLEAPTPLSTSNLFVAWPEVSRNKQNGQNPITAGYLREMGRVSSDVQLMVLAMVRCMLINSEFNCISSPVSASKILIMSIMPAAISVPEGCQDRDIIRPGRLHKTTSKYHLDSF